MSTEQFVRNESVSDTSAEAQLVIDEIYRQMTPQRKSEIMNEMIEDVRELARSGIRNRHPEYSPDDVEIAMFRLWVGDDRLADLAWPNHTHLKP